MEKALDQASGSDSHLANKFVSLKLWHPPTPKPKPSVPETVFHSSISLIPPAMDNWDAMDLHSPNSYWRDKIRFQNGQPTPSSEFARIYKLNKTKHQSPSNPPLKPIVHFPNNQYPYFDTLHISSHSCIDLKELLIKHNSLRYPELRESQNNAIDEFHQLMSNPGNIFPEESGHLKKFFNVFDHLFFLGALSEVPLVTIDFTIPGQIPAFKKSETITPQSPLSRRVKIVENYMVRIRLLDLRWGKGEDEILPLDVRLKVYLELLLHAMLHAYFDIFGCDCKDCFANEGIKHGFSWQHTAKVIEESARDYLYNGFFDLDRRRGWSEEKPEYRNKFKEVILKKLGLKAPESERFDVFVEENKRLVGLGIDELDTESDTSGGGGALVKHVEWADEKDGEQGQGGVDVDIIDEYFEFQKWAENESAKDEKAGERDSGVDCDMDEDAVMSMESLGEQLVIPDLPIRKKRSRECSRETRRRMKLSPSKRLTETDED